MAPSLRSLHWYAWLVANPQAISHKIECLLHVLSLGAALCYICPSLHLLQLRLNFLQLLLQSALQRSFIECRCLQRGHLALYRFGYKLQQLELRQGLGVLVAGAALYRPQVYRVAVGIPEYPWKS